MGKSNPRRDEMVEHGEVLGGRHKDKQAYKRSEEGKEGMKLINIVIGASLAAAQCTNPRVRKEIRELSEQELREFQDAINKLHRERKRGREQLSSYEYFTYLHNTYAQGAHFTPAFLPWHRYFIRKFEMELQRFNPNVMLPYWDWSLDATAPHRSPVLTDKFMGGNGGNGNCVRDGPFANWKMGYPTAHCLRRSYDQGRRLSAFSSPESIQLDINQRRFSDFSVQFEIKHGRPHNSIGANGVDFSQMYSPNDPIFFLHHAFVDLVWDKWQQRNPSTRYEGERYRMRADARDKLAGFDGITVNSTLRMDDAFYCYTYPQYPRLIISPKVPSRLRSVASSVAEANPFADELREEDLDSALLRIPNITQSTKMAAVSSDEAFGKLPLLQAPGNLTQEFVASNRLNPDEVRQAQAKEKELIDKLNALEGFRSISAIQALLNDFV